MDGHYSFLCRRQIAWMGTDEEEIGGFQLELRLI